MTKTAEKTEIEKIGNSPAEMMAVAVNGGYTPEQIMKMLDAQERYDAIQAKKAYNQAMSDFKEKPPLVTKDKQNSQYKSMYTTLGNLVNTVTPELSKHGLSASWDIKQNGTIEVSCRMTHRLGHSETATASAPADTSGAKNAIQQIKSTITYLKAVTFESVCGLASTDANHDDDANSAGAPILEKEPASINRTKIPRTKIDDMTIDQIRGFEMLVGKYKGMTIDFIAGQTTDAGIAKGVEYLEWFSGQVAETEVGKKCQDAIKRYLEEIVYQDGN